MTKQRIYLSKEEWKIKKLFNCILRIWTQVIGILLSIDFCSSSSASFPTGLRRFCSMSIKNISKFWNNFHLDYWWMKLLCLRKHMDHANLKFQEKVSSDFWLMKCWIHSIYSKFSQLRFGCGKDTPNMLTAFLPFRYLECLRICM